MKIKCADEVKHTLIHEIVSIQIIVFNLAPIRFVVLNFRFFG